MTLSIITAVYNRRETVAGAIESLRAQTHSAFEHVIVDGGSTDGTLEVIERLSDHRTRLASGPDEGIYDALNKGLERASGEIVGLMHSDDFYADDRVLERVADAFTDPAVDAVYGDLQYVSATDTARIIRHWRSGEYRRGRLARGWMPPHPTLYLRRRVIERWGGYDTSYRIAADYDAILRYFGRGAIRAAYIPEVLVKMRVGGHSNRSLGQILAKSREDYRALRANGVGGLGALAWKNLGKLDQFVRR